MPPSRGIQIGVPSSSEGALLEQDRSIGPEVMPERGSERTQDRMPAREYYRSMARPEPVQEGALKYHIDRRDFVPDCAHEWVAIRVNGMDAGQLRRSLAKGWVPA